MTKELQAPWPDFAGQPIHHGDEIAHPFSGERGTVIYCPDVNSTLEADRWRVIYENANFSRLCLQIGDKGQAVVTQRAFQPAQEPVTLPALDTLKIVARDAFMNGLSWMEANRDSRPEEWRQAADDWMASWVDSENNPLNYPHECAAPGCGCEGHCAADDANDRIVERLRFNAAQKAAPAPAVDRGLSEAQEREAFEDWGKHSRHAFRFTRFPASDEDWPGQYKMGAEQAGWEAWQARAALSTPSPVAPEPISSKDAAEALLSAGHEFWLSVGRENYKAQGAVQWLTASDGTLVLFTRGEYRQTLLNNIAALPGAAVVNWEHPGDEDEDEHSLLACAKDATPAEPVAPGGVPASVRIALENFDSMEPLGPTTEAVIDAVQRWYLAPPAPASEAQQTKGDDHGAQ